MIFIQCYYLVSTDTHQKKKKGLKHLMGNLEFYLETKIWVGSIIQSVLLMVLHW